MKTILKLVICWVAFAASPVAGGILAKILHLQLASTDISRRMPTHFALILFAGALLVLGLYPIARGLAGSVGSRAIALIAFLALALGVNTLLEMSIFSDFFVGIVPAMAVLYAMEALFVGAALGGSFGLKDTPMGLAKISGTSWASRGLIAWLSWPLTYFIFGACIAPIVTPYYNNGGILGLHLPPLGVILEMQLVRSLIFLAASLPLIALWKGSRLGLWLALGLAHAFTVGIYGTVAGSFLPGILRITHGAEITCDSFAYAGLLVLLFAAPPLPVEKHAAIPVAVA